MLKTETEVHEIRNSKGKNGKNGVAAGQQERSIKGVEPVAKNNIDISAIKNLGFTVKTKFHTDIQTDNENLIIREENKLSSLINRTSYIQESIQKAKQNEQSREEIQASLIRRRACTNGLHALKQQKCYAQSDVEVKTSNLTEHQTVLAKSKQMKTSLIIRQNEIFHHKKGLDEEFQCVEVLEESIPQEIAHMQQSLQQQQAVKIQMKRIHAFPMNESNTLTEVVPATVRISDFQAVQDNKDDFILACSTALSQIDVSLGISFENIIQRAFLLFPYSNVCDYVGNIIAFFLGDALVLQRTHAQKYFAESLLDDLVLNEQCDTFNLEKSEFFKMLQKCADTTSF